MFLNWFALHVCNECIHYKSPMIRLLLDFIRFLFCSKDEFYVYFKVMSEHILRTWTKGEV